MIIGISGCLGFIGSHLVDYVLRLPGASVSGLDGGTYAAEERNIEQALKSPQFQLLKGSTADPEVADSWVRECDYLIHAGAESSVDRSIISPAEFFHQNVLGGYNVVEAVRKYNRRLLYLSTDEVMGHLPPNGKFPENGAVMPRNPYSWSKSCTDRQVYAWVETYRINACTVRLSNCYGPRQQWEKLLPVIIWSLLHDQPVPVYGDGKQERTWTYVGDACSAIFRILMNGKPGQVYNVATSDTRYNIDVVRKAIDILNKPGDLIRYVEDRPGHDRRYALEVWQIQQIGGGDGWRPQMSFDDGVRLTIDWFSRPENIDWLNRCRERDKEFKKRNFDDRKPHAGAV